MILIIGHIRALKSHSSPTIGIDLCILSGRPVVSEPNETVDRDENVLRLYIAMKPTCLMYGVNSTPKSIKVAQQNRSIYGERYLE
jgi:hypothetical protein